MLNGHWMRPLFPIPHSANEEVHSLVLKGEVKRQARTVKDTLFGQGGGGGGGVAGGGGRGRAKRFNPIILHKS